MPDRNTAREQADLAASKAEGVEEHVAETRLLLLQRGMGATRVWSARRVKAQEAGFDGLWISDHYHPWNDEQGHSPFVWSTIGAIAQATEGMKVTTAVTCPTMRIHPAIIAQAAATSAVLLDRRFCLGLGTGEALNEHILGDRWPGADERLEMLEEAVEVIRTLWQGGVQDHRGRHYRVEHCPCLRSSRSPAADRDLGLRGKAVELAEKIGNSFPVGTRSSGPIRSPFSGRRGSGPGQPVLETSDALTGHTQPSIGYGQTRRYPVSWPRSCQRRNILSRRASWSPKTWWRRSCPAAQTSSAISKRSTPTPKQGWTTLRQPDRS